MVCKNWNQLIAIKFFVPIIEKLDKNEKKFEDLFNDVKGLRQQNDNSTKVLNRIPILEKGTGLNHPTTELGKAITFYITS